MHQITSAALNILLDRAYSHYSANVESSIDFGAWCDQKAKLPSLSVLGNCAGVRTLCCCVCAILERGKFCHVSGFSDRIVPLFFALDHPNYAH